MTAGRMPTQQADTRDDRTRRCESCRLPQDICICGEIEVARVPVEFLLIQTGSETTSQSNTGRLVERVLEDSRSVIYDAPEAPLDLTKLADPAAEYRVLFPRPGAPVVSRDLIPQDPARRLSIILLDASWRRARRMSRKISCSRRIPFVRLPDGLAPRCPLRRPTAPGQLNTAETAAWALDLLGFPEAADALRRALEAMFRRVLRVRGRRARPVRADTRPGIEG